MTCGRCGYDAGFTVAVCPQCGARTDRRELATQRATVAQASGHAPTEESDAYLFVRSGPDQGLQFPVGARTTVGRAPACTALLNDPRVSQEHARVVQQGDAFVYIDELSSNRSFLVTAQGETALSGPHSLRDGDTIRVGHTVLQFIDTRRRVR